MRARRDLETFHDLADRCFPTSKQIEEARLTGFGKHGNSLEREALIIAKKCDNLKELDSDIYNSLMPVTTVRDKRVGCLV